MSDTSNPIRRFHAGEPQAFAEIIGAYKDDVYTICLRMLGPDQAEGATETIFLEAHQAMYRLQPDTILDDWLLRRTVEHTLQAVPNANADALNESSALIQRILNELEPTFRIAVILRDVLRLSEDKIADILDLPLGTARSRIHRGRLTLGRNFSPHLDQT